MAVWHGLSNVACLAARTGLLGHAWTRRISISDAQSIVPIHFRKCRRRGDIAGPNREKPKRGLVGKCRLGHAGVEHWIAGGNPAESALIPIRAPVR